MKTYVQLLQIHSKIKNISYPNNLIRKDIELPTVLWNRSIDECSTGNFWTCIFREECNGELGFDNNTFHFQIYFFISSMAYFYGETLDKQISRKYLLMDQTTTNIFLSSKVKDDIRDIFYKTQRTYFALLRFANIIRHKIGKEKIDTDLRMDPIDIRSKYSLCLYHSNAKYFFALTDLVNIIQTAITQSQDMFPNPLWPKNPYNNLPFSKTHIYNIYFRIKFVYLTVPSWIQFFFLSGFNLEQFVMENEQVLREQYIKNYVNNSSVNVLYDEVTFMINQHKRVFRHINIHEDISKKEIVNIFRPYLYIYTINEYSIDGTEKKQLARIILLQKLEEFVRYNRNFGRKNITTNCVNVSIDLSSNDSTLLSTHIFNRQLISTVTYNLVHIPFTMNDAYNSFVRKNIYRPTIRTYQPPQIHRRNHRQIFDANDFSDDDDDQPAQEITLPLYLNDVRSEGSVSDNDSEAELEFLTNELHLINRIINQEDPDNIDELERNDTDSIS